MLNTGKKQRTIHTNIPSCFILPEKNPLYTFDILTLIAKLCDDNTLYNLPEVCRYFRSVISLQPQFEARLWKVRYIKLSLKYRVLKKLKAKEAEEEKRISLDVDPSLIFCRQLNVTINFRGRRDPREERH